VASALTGNLPASFAAPVEPAGTGANGRGRSEEALRPDGYVPLLSIDPASKTSLKTGTGDIPGVVRIGDSIRAGKEGCRAVPWLAERLSRFAGIGY
jgi:hypothetical protein